jgi:hypothetical protein
MIAASAVEALLIPPALHIQTEDMRRWGPKQSQSFPRAHKACATPYAMCYQGMPASKFGGFSTKSPDGEERREPKTEIREQLP